MTRYSTITFVSDYGASSEMVGVCKSVMRTISPGASVIDLTHDVAPFDVRAASLALVRAAHYLAPGVVVGVVDPGAGTKRRGIVVELNSGESLLVGPDNGLLAPVTALVGGPTRVFELTNQDYMLASPNGARSGRDLFAPIAAHLSAGVAVEELGHELDPANLVPGLVPFSGEKDGVLHADVIWIDRFGNVELNATADQIVDFGETIELSHGSQRVRARRIDAYADLGKGELGVLVDSHGLVSLVAGYSSAANGQALQLGDAVKLSRGLSVS